MEMLGLFLRRSFPSEMRSGTVVVWFERQMAFYREGYNPIIKKEDQASLYAVLAASTLEQYAGPDITIEKFQEVIEDEAEDNKSNEKLKGFWILKDRNLLDAVNNTFWSKVPLMSGSCAETKFPSEIKELIDHGQNHLLAVTPEVKKYIEAHSLYQSERVYFLSSSEEMNVNEDEEQEHECAGKLAIRHFEKENFDSGILQLKDNYTVSKEYTEEYLNTDPFHYNDTDFIDLVAYGLKDPSRIEQKGYIDGFSIRLCKSTCHHKLFLSYKQSRKSI